MKYVLGGIAGLVGVGIFVFLIYITFFPSGKALINSYDNLMKQVDDKTNYLIYLLRDFVSCLIKWMKAFRERRENPLTLTNWLSKNLAFSVSLYFKNSSSL